MSRQAGKPTTEAEVTQLLDADLFLAGRVSWTLDPQSVRGRLIVGNRAGQDVRLHLRIVRALPWRYHFVLTWGTLEIRKLDVRDDHTNPGTSPDVWRLRTHKHRYTDRWGSRWAYTPSDLPEAAAPTVSLDEYHDMFLAFCVECGINTTDFTWHDPPITPREEQL